MNDHRVLLDEVIYEVTVPKDFSPAAIAAIREFLDTDEVVTCVMELLMSKAARVEPGEIQVSTWLSYKPRREVKKHAPAVPAVGRRADSRIVPITKSRRGGS